MCSSFICSIYDGKYHNRNHKKADTEVAVEDGMMFVKVAAGDALSLSRFAHRSQASFNWN